jgi:hypothetical protein
VTLNPFDADKHHIALGEGTPYGWTLENAYSKFMQKETTRASGSDFGGTLDLITSDKPEVSRWTQDEFTGGAFQYSFDTDQAMFADCIGYMPSQQAKSVITVPPVFFKESFNVVGMPNPAGRTNIKFPHSMFTVAGSIFVCFEHGILRYLTGTGDFVWGNYMIDDDIDGNRHWYAAAEYDRNEQCIYVLVNCLDTAALDKPFFLRLDPETLEPWGTANTLFNDAPARTENQKGWGFEINDQHLVVGIGWRLYTVDPPEKPADASDEPVWTHIGRMPGRWIDSVAYNGMTYILTATADSKTQIVAFDGTYILPIANLAFNFYGRCITVYGGRVYIGGTGTDINGGVRYAELHELTGSSTRLVRTFAPESYQSRVTFPKDLWDLTVAEGLLWWSEKGVRLWTYDLTGDAFFGSSEIQSPGVNFYKHVVGRERLWLWGSHDTDAAQHGIYRIAIEGDTVGSYEGRLTTSDFLSEFALEKRWHEIVVLSRYHAVSGVDYSTDGGATWTALTGGVASTSGDLKFLTFDLEGLATSKVIRFRIHQPMGTEVDEFGELIAYTVSFTFTSASGQLKHGWNLMINGAENVEARDGTTQHQDVDLMKTTLWGWAEGQKTLTYRDLGGKTYTVKMQDFVEQQPIIGPNVTDGDGPECYFAVTLLES